MGRELFAIRYRNWKVHFQLKDDWFAGAMLKPTVPRPVDLRNDPFEQHMDAPNYPNYRREAVDRPSEGRDPPAAQLRHTKSVRRARHRRTSTLGYSSKR
jgi:hypothetical protein